MTMAVFLSVAAALALQAAPAAEPAEPIVVTGTRLPDYRAALAACLARECPPDEDIDATLALAEALFVAGEYRDARAAVRASLDRNRGEAASYPEPVSDLYRADARVARHLGLDRDAMRSTAGILNALEAGLPEQDHRHFGARLEMSESLAAFGRYGEAREELERLEDAARRAGREDVAAIAHLRSLWILYLADPHGAAPQRLKALAEATDAERRPLSTGAKILLSRIYRERGDAARADALLAEAARGGGKARPLLFSPPYELPVQERVNPAGDHEIKNDSAALAWGNTINRLSGSFEKTWIDVGFWVEPDGRVSGVEILRKSGQADWAAPLLRSIKGRRYAASTEPGPAYRLERYSYTAGYEERTGSRLPRRSPRARVEYLDLTN